MYDAIAADPSLQPITLGVVQLARDLCDVAPLVDVARAVKAAGAWTRGDPTDRRRKKTNGNAFLLNWLQRAQDDEARKPRPATPFDDEPPLPPPKEPPRYKPPPPLVKPEPDPEPDPWEVTPEELEHEEQLKKQLEAHRLDPVWRGDVAGVAS